MIFWLVLCGRTQWSDNSEVSANISSLILFSYQHPFNLSQFVFASFYRRKFSVDIFSLKSMSNAREYTAHINRWLLSKSPRFVLFLPVTSFKLSTKLFPNWNNSVEISKQTDRQAACDNSIYWINFGMYFVTQTKMINQSNFFWMDDAKLLHELSQFN